MKNIVFISIWLLTVSAATGGELVLSGAYTGKPVFVQNPFNHSQNAFCALEVYVNDRKLFDAPQISAFKIDLSYLRINDLVVIRITFSDGCRPRIVNPDVIQPRDDFRFISSQADHSSVSWTTAGEIPGGQFIVEKYDSKGDEWQVFRSIMGRGDQRQNQYSEDAEHQSGENKYRIRYESPDGNIFYSVEVVYASTVQPVTFYPEIVTSKITLSDSTSYTITDAAGKLIKRGEGTEITVSELNPGEYFLNIQNRKERFVKK